MPYLDRRFKKVIVLNGIYNYCEWLQTTVVNQIAELRKITSSQDYQTYVKSIAPYDAIGYLNKKNDIEFYFQAGKNNQALSEYDILSCYEMTNSEKEIQWYHSPPDLNEQALTDRLEKIMKWANEYTSR
jgi:hypothetical protein